MTTHPKSEDIFIETLNRILEKNLADSSFSVTRLTRLIGMSRTDFHRKIINRTGFSATAYIRQIRVQRAGELLLKHPDWDICDVAFEVGFNTPGYFSRVFKDIKGVGPAKYRDAKSAMHGFQMKLFFDLKFEYYEQKREK